MTIGTAVWLTIGAEDFTSDLQLSDFVAAAITEANKALEEERLAPIIKCGDIAFGSVHVSFYSDRTSDTELLLAHDALQRAVDGGDFNVTFVNGTGTNSHVATFWNASTSSILTTTTTEGPGVETDKSQAVLQSNEAIWLLSVVVLLVVLLILVTVVYARSRRGQDDHANAEMGKWSANPHATTSLENPADLMAAEDFEDIMNGPRPDERWSTAPVTLADTDAVPETFFAAERPKMKEPSGYLDPKSYPNARETLELPKPKPTSHFYPDGAGGWRDHSPVVIPKNPTNVRS